MLKDAQNDEENTNEDYYAKKCFEMLRNASLMLRNATKC